VFKRTLQNYSKFSKRSLKERNLAVSGGANFASQIIQTSLKKCSLKILFVFIVGFLIVALFVGLANAAGESDVAYILEDNSELSQKILDSLDEFGLSYDVVKDSEIPSKDFSKYSILIITEDVSNRELIPYDEVHAIFFDRRIAGSVWDIVSSGKTTGRKIEVEIEDSFVFDELTIPPNDELVIYSGFSGGGIHYLILSSQSNVEVVAFLLSLELRDL